VHASRGVYATVTVAAGAQNFINYVILNGLTYNDNAQGYDAQLLSGLSQTYYATGSTTVTLKYAAEQGEEVTFDVTEISTGTLKAEVKMGGQSLASRDRITSSSSILVKAPSSGEMQVLVTTTNAPTDSMFSITTDSNVPIKNCTVGVGSPNSGLSTGAKAGIGVGVTAAVLGLLGTGGWFAYKHFFGGGGASAPAAAPAPGDGGLSYGPMAEKLAAQPTITPLDPATTAMPPGMESAPMSHAPGQMPMHATGMEGAGIDPSSGGLSAQAPHTGLENLAPSATPGAAAPPGAPPPNVFVPVGPFVPPPFSPYAPPSQQSPHSPYGSPSPGNPAGPYPPPDPTATYPGHAPSPQPHSPYGSPHPASPYSPLPGHPGQQPMFPGQHTGLELPPNPTGTEVGTQPPAGCPPYGMPAGGAPQVFVPPVGAVGLATEEMKHHHHPWLAPGQPCEDGACPFNARGHVCANGGCECRCLNPGCPLNR
jgi:hypothetical protein